MSDPILIGLDTNAAPIARQLSRFTETMGKGVARAMDLQNELTVGYIQAAKLSRRGPRTLGVVTNRLRLSIRPNLAVVTGTTISSAIGSNVAYAGVHEYGFDGQVQVRSFTRKNARGNLFGGSARHEFNPKTGRITKGKPAKQVASGFSIVKAHQRHMKMPERSFIRTGISERAKNYRDAISAAITAGWNQPSSTP